jgi:hypothetical protein
MIDDPDDLDAVLEACWRDLYDSAPGEATKSISSRVARLDRAARLSVLNAFLDDHEADSVFWPIFLEWWADWEFPHRWENLTDRLRGLHRVIRAYPFMSPNNQAFFDRLPERTCLYRGASGGFPLGISWTLDKSKAEWFARRFRKPDASVVSGKICKQHVWLCLWNEMRMRFFAIHWKFDCKSSMQIVVD